MEKFSVDYDSLLNTVNQPKEYKLSDVQDRIERVAFNTVRFRDNADTEQLWEIKESGNGPVIVALYNDSGQKEVQGDWDVSTEVKTASINVYYKGDPIVRIAASDLKIPFDEIHMVRRWLPKKLNTEEGARSFILSFASNDSINLIKRSYPEIKKEASLSRHVPIVKTNPNELRLRAAAITINAADVLSDMQAQMRDLLKSLPDDIARAERAISRDYQGEMTEEKRKRMEEAIQILQEQKDALALLLKKDSASANKGAK